MQCRPARFPHRPDGDGYHEVMSIADELRTAGLSVIEGRSGIGRTVGVSGVVSRITGTAKTVRADSDLNDIVVPARGVAYIERSGRVWLLADGPVVGDEAVVWIAAYRESDITASQLDSLAAVEAALSAVYALSPVAVPEPTDLAATDESAPDPDDEGEDA